jgi:hypothetical protein
MRNALMHFDQWSRGKGLGPQRGRVKAGEALRDVARDYWHFGYDPDTATVSFGPYTLAVDRAEQAAHDLCQAIYAAAREVDNRNTAERRRKDCASARRRRYPLRHTGRGSKGLSSNRPTDLVITRPDGLPRRGRAATAFRADCRCTREWRASAPINQLGRTPGAGRMLDARRDAVCGVERLRPL